RPSPCPLPEGEGESSSINLFTFFTGRFYNMKHKAVLIAVVFLWLCPQSFHAQQRGARGSAPATAKARAPIDLTGYWTAVITEDWHTRMLTAPRGDFGSGAPGAIVNPNTSEAIGTGENPAAQGNIPYNVK